MQRATIIAAIAYLLACVLSSLIYAAFSYSVRAAYGMPAWLFAALVPFVVLGAWLLQRHLDRRRALKAPGVCPSCGYDRTGLAPEGSCPECGASSPNS